MSTLRRPRGTGKVCYKFCVALFAILSAAGVARAEGDAKLLTYRGEDGPTYFALSLAPPETGSHGPVDLVILFDTSASQTGAYRETAFAALEACVAKLRVGDRVQILAADLDARPLTDQFVSPGGTELNAAIQELRNEPPLGTTDMEGALKTAAGRFEKFAKSYRAVLYIGDGMSAANLLGAESFGEIVEQLRGAQISVSSYAIGPRLDGTLLATIANQTGGNLYVDEGPAVADEVAGISIERAAQENSRRGTKIGETLADWTQARVIWPAKTTFPAELGDVYPSAMPPLRSDRDTVVVGSTDQEFAAPMSVVLEDGSKSIDSNFSWIVAPQESNEDYAYLAQIVEDARSDEGLTMPTVGLAGLSETGRMINARLESMTEVAQRAVSMGDMRTAAVMSQAVLARDPGNVRAQTVQRVVQRPAGGAKPPAGATQEARDLSLVRTAQGGPVLGGPTVAPDADFPAAGALTDRFDPEGALLGEVEQQKRVFAQMLRREIENAVIDARRTMSDNPDAAAQQLKLALQNVERAPELNPDVRAQLIDRLRIALRDVQRAATIKDELDAEREEQLAAARERQLLNDRLARNQEREKQLVGRFNALVDEARFDEHHYDEAVEVSNVLRDIEPAGVVPLAAYNWGALKRNFEIEQAVRAERWTQFFNTLHTIEVSSIPFPDEPPIIYPDAPVWEELSARRKKYASVDLSSSGGAEERINNALNSPLQATGLEFTETPLSEVVATLQDEYKIPIQLDAIALEDAGLSADEPVTINLSNVTLRSALRLMLKNLKLTYIIEDEVMQITTPEDADTRLIAKVYPVADLVLPVTTPQIQGGGIGGQMGGGQGGGGGGLGGGGGGGGFGGGGGGQQGGGGGGFFSVPDDVGAGAQPQAASTPGANAKRQAFDKSKVAAIAIDESVSAGVFWNGYFAERRDEAAVRQTARELLDKKKYDQAIAMIEAALRNGQPQPWMYESLGIAMELAGRPKAEIERAVMSAVDFSTTSNELMYIAAYLSRSGMDRRALQVCQQVVKREPLRREAYALGLRSAQRSDDLSGIQWATVGVLSQAWTKDESSIEETATQMAHATLDRLEKEGRQEELAAYRKQLDAAIVRDCLVQVSWTGNADVDIEVEEPAGTICSQSNARTAGGGVNVNDAYAGKQDASSPAILTETYICPQAFAGTYRARIHRVWGEVAAGKVTVDVYRHVGSENVEHERQQLDVGDKDAMVVFDVNQGRRTEPLEVGQLAGAVERQQQVSRSVLAQQVASMSDPRVLAGLGGGSDVLLRRRLLGALGRGGAVGFQPIIQVLPEGTMMSGTAVISADRRYVRVSVAPIFSTIGDVQTFTFAGAARQTGTGTGTDTGTGTGTGTVPAPPLISRGGGGFGGR